MKVPYPITLTDEMELLPEIKEAKRLTVWDQDTKSRVQTRSMKIHWKDPNSQNRYIWAFSEDTAPCYFPFPPPVRCYKCQKCNHTFSTCHSKQDVCGLCGGQHRTKVYVEKKANQKGKHCRASARCPYLREVIYRRRPVQQVQLP